MAVAARIATGGVAWLLMYSSAAAHPGHGQGGGDFSPLHYLIEPQHLFSGILPLLVLVRGVWYFMGILRTRARRRS